MSEKQNLPEKFADRFKITLPEFNSTPPIELDISNIKTGEKRLIEAKIVNGATYSELEYVFNEGYREAKKHISTVGYQITQAQKALRQAKSVALLDHYNDFLKEKKLKDSAAIRDAFLENQEDYTKAQDRLDMLMALMTLLDGKIKVFENVCRYMKKEMDIQLRSGMIDSNKYGTRT